MRYGRQANRPQKASAKRPKSAVEHPQAGGCAARRPTQTPHKPEENMSPASTPIPASASVSTSHEVLPPLPQALHTASSTLDRLLLGFRWSAWSIQSILSTPSLRVLCLKAIITFFGTSLVLGALILWIGIPYFDDAAKSAKQAANQIPVLGAIAGAVAIAAVVLLMAGTWWLSTQIFAKAAASLWMDQMTERTHILLGKPLAQQNSVVGWAQSAWREVKTMTILVVVFAAISVGLFTLQLIPLVGTILYVVLQFWWACLFLSMSLCEASMAIREISWRRRLAWMWRHRATLSSFGVTAFFLTWVGGLAPALLVGAAAMEATSEA